MGSTITDGGLTWTCRALNVNTGADTAMNVGAALTVLTEGKYGFDPFGLLTRAHSETSRVKSTKARVVVLENGQSDAQASSGSQSTVQGWYTAALMSMANYFAIRGYTVFIGLTCFQPSSQTYQYDTLAASVAATVTAQATLNPGKVFAGANLYSTLGSVHGSNRLFLQSDNSHVAENVHTQGSTALLAADAWTAALQSALPKG